MNSVTPKIDQTSGAFTTNTQTMIEFGRIWAAGCRKFSDIMTNASQAHLDHMTTTMKAMSDIKTINGAMDLQMAATRTSIEQAIANSSKLSIALMEFADQGMAPLKARMDVTMAKLTSSRPT